MTQPTSPRPLNSHVARNDFRGRAYEPERIPTFEEARELLPVPVLPQHPKWVEMYWRAWEIAWQHLRQPKIDSGFVANFMDNADNDNTFMWDSAFMTQFGIYARRAFDCRGTLDNFYAKQHDDGFICRALNRDTGNDYFYPFDPNGTGPNVLAWAEWRLFRHTKDLARLEAVFWPLLALHDWFRAHRTWPTGLYWATGLSSGMDNQPRTARDPLHHGHCTWIDANAQAALNCRALAQMAHVLEETEHAGTLSEERSFLHRVINARMWNEDTRFYHDVDAGGKFGPAKSIGAYWTLLDKDLVPEKKLELFVRHLREPGAFNRPHRIPTLSADSEGYDGETGNYWCGGVWSPTNYMVLKGLRHVGQRRLAYQIALNHLQHVCEVFQHTDTFWEYYAPEGSDPGRPAKPNFVGCSGVSPISILLEDVLGVSVDWPLRRVVLDRRLPGDAPYGVRNYPLGPEGNLDVIGDDKTVEITTSLPFSLTLRHGESTLQTAVPAGQTTLEL